MVCDYCGETEIFEEFMSAVDFKKNESWRSIYDEDDDEWSDMCHECVLEEYRTANEKDDDEYYY